MYALYSKGTHGKLHALKFHFKINLWSTDGESSVVVGQSYFSPRKLDAKELLKTSMKDGMVTSQDFKEPVSIIFTIISLTHTPLYPKSFHYCGPSQVFWGEFELKISV